MRASTKFTRVSPYLITPDLQTAGLLFANTGITRQYGAHTPLNGSTIVNSAPPQGDDDGIPSDCYLWNFTAQASPSGFLETTTFPASHQGQVTFQGDSGMPINPPNPPIHWNLTVTNRHHQSIIADRKHDSRV